MATDTVKASITILNRLGLHARPAMALVDAANRYQANVIVRKGDTAVDAKSIMQVMLLAATQGTQLEVEADGPDAQQAIDDIKALVNRRFDENE